MRVSVTRARGGHVQGFPCRHYGRCVLDEHIAKRPMPGGSQPRKAKCIEAEQNGRKQKSPDGRPRGRVCLVRLASERPPVFPIFFRKEEGQFFDKSQTAKSRAWRP